MTDRRGTAQQEQQEQQQQQQQQHTSSNMDFIFKDNLQQHKTQNKEK
jgi:hypothetical protein